MRKLLIMTIVFILSFTTQTFSAEIPTVDAEKIKEQKTLTDDEFELLCSLVEAEAGVEDYIGKYMVANVVFNRVKDSTFPNDVISVIMDSGQFSTVLSGSIYRKEVTEETRIAVYDAIYGEDMTDGALFFVNPYSGKDGWFKEKLHFAVNHGRHDFYKY